MTIHPRAIALAIALGAALAGSCLDVAEDRARRDLTVGQAEIGESRVSVHEGLAAVRRIEPGKLWLWAGAPRLSIRMEIGTASGGPWEITIENVLSDAELSAQTTTGERLGVTLVDAPRPTRRSWTVQMPPGSTVTLELRTPDAETL